MNRECVEAPRGRIDAVLVAFDEMARECPSEDDDLCLHPDRWEGDLGCCPNKCPLLKND